MAVVWPEYRQVDESAKEYVDEQVDALDARVTVLENAGG